MVQEVHAPGRNDRPRDAPRHRRTSAERGRVPRGTASIRALLSNHRRIDDEVQHKQPPIRHVAGIRGLQRISDESSRGVVPRQCVVVLGWARGLGRSFGHGGRAIRAWLGTGPFEPQPRILDLQPIRDDSA